VQPEALAAEQLELVLAQRLQLELKLVALEHRHQA
jgi:hypothetical protein